MIKFIYLETGSKQKYQTELRYSISTLLAEMPEAAGNIIVYTDNPSAYAADSHLLSTFALPEALDELPDGSKYFFRVKPGVLLLALRTFGCPCVFLDTDTYVKRGFSRALKSKLRRGAVMDRYLRKNPFPECAGLDMTLPSGLSFRYDAETAVIYNSGVIGVRPDHAAAIEDSIAIIDAVRPLSYKRNHDQEQYAVNEALSIHGVPISVIHRTLRHYCPRWQKRYIHWRFERMDDAGPVPIVPRRPRIAVNKAIGSVFKRTSKYLK